MRKRYLVNIQVEVFLECEDDDNPGFCKGAAETIAFNFGSIDDAGTVRYGFADGECDAEWYLDEGFVLEGPFTELNYECNFLDVEVVEI